MSNILKIIAPKRSLDLLIHDTPKHREIFANRHRLNQTIPLSIYQDASDRLQNLTYGDYCHIYYFSEKFQGMVLSSVDQSEITKNIISRKGLTKACETLLEPLVLIGDLDDCYQAAPIDVYMTLQSCLLDNQFKPSHTASMEYQELETEFLSSLTLENVTQIFPQFQSMHQKQIWEAIKTKPYLNHGNMPPFCRYNCNSTMMLFTRAFIKEVKPEILKDGPLSWIERVRAGLD